MYSQTFLNIDSLKDHDKESLDILPYLKEVSHTLPLFQELTQKKTDLSAVLPLVDEIRKGYTDVLFLGTGGSSLGGQALYALRTAPSPRLHFHDNIDPHTFSKLFDTISPSRTKVIAISKSGETAETLMQLLVCIEHWQAHGLKISNHFIGLTEPGDTSLRHIGHHYQFPLFDHPSQIGGRFSVFTLVGMLPALLCGLNIEDFREGACSVLKHMRQVEKAGDCPPLLGACVQYKGLSQHLTQTVLMPYVDRLSVFSMWYRQLWAESLGKQGKGLTPIQALGTVDQHSQLQLYLDGPKDKFFTLITLDHETEVFRVSSPLLSLFKGKSMGDLMNAESQATIDTLMNHHCPLRVFHLMHLNEKGLGALMMHFILETLAMAFLLHVNPFDQPAVEESKILTRKYLGQG